MLKEDIKKAIADICDNRLKALGEYDFFKDASLEIKFWRVTGLVNNDIEGIIDRCEESKLDTMISEFTYYIPSGSAFESSDGPSPDPYASKYLTTEALESGTISFNIWKTMGTEYITSISYSLDDGKTWETINNEDDKEENLVIEVEVNEGDEVLWKGDAKQTGANGYGSYFSSTARFNVKGNVMSLCYGDNFIDKDELKYEGQFAYLFYDSSGKSTCKVVNANNLSLPATTLANYCYYRMFQGCSSLTNAPKLPATTLPGYCYYAMFLGCTSLVTAPELPATTLAVYCYAAMFSDCTSLTTAHELPATTLTGNCYNAMFYGCTSLVTAPELPATTLADACYNYMFSGCTSLVTAPELPATTLANNCYQYMFQDCTSLVTAPELPATTLTGNCYNGMFWGCTSLTTAPELPATTLAQVCYGYMFNGCTSLNTAPELPATTLVNNCYGYMFSGCTKLNYIKAMFTTTPGNEYTDYWVSGVSATGTFVRNENATWEVWGVHGIPENWTVEPPIEHDYSKCYFTLVTLANNTFNINVPNGGVSYSLNDGSTWSAKSGSFTVNVPSGGKLLLKGDVEFNGASQPSTPYIQSTGNYSIEGNIMSLSYEDDFADKKTIQTNYEYAHFFENDTKLISAENLVLPATTLTTGCYLAMFNGCTSLTTAPELPAMVLTASCYESMFSGSAITTSPRLNALDFTATTSYCYRNMFAYCEHLNNIYAMFRENPNAAATNPLAEEPNFAYTYNWIYGIGETGEFYKNANAYWNIDTTYIKGPSGIPTNTGCVTPAWQLIDVTPSCSTSISEEP